MSEFCSQKSRKVLFFWKRIEFRPNYSPLERGKKKKERNALLFYSGVCFLGLEIGKQHLGYPNAR